MSTILPFPTKPPGVRPDRVSRDDLAIAAQEQWCEPCKHAIDFVLALSLFIVTSPLLLLTMVVVKLLSRGPALYVQLRTGRSGRPFALYKIRSMHHQCEKNSGVQWSVPGDKRVFPLGRWLRRLHLDELPQLWNVIRGDMSLIGPRPERPEFVPQLEQAIRHYRQRLLIRPGVTGLAQVQLPPDSDLHSVRVKLAYDLYYLRHVSLWFDLRIFAATFCKCIGMPFPVIRLLFAFPVKEIVLAHFHNLSSSASKA